MGSGCSSPLRRFGGKRGASSSTHRDSDPYGMNAADDQLDQKRSTIKTTHFTHQHKIEQQPVKTNLDIAGDQECTVQSENNDDHPSTGSFNTDCKNYQGANQPCNPDDHKPIDPLSTPNTTPHHPQTGNGAPSLFARMKGLNGTYVPHDRHLLVSPALSPAPSSTCYSPPPATSALGQIASLDLNELVEAFEILTFGLPNDKIPIPIKQQSELQQYYTQHLVKNENDLINSISVIFISADSFNCSNSSQEDKGESTKTINTLESNILAKQIEANVKTFCDDHIFNLRFFNLSHANLKHNFHVNNLLDVTLSMLEQEYKLNSQRIIIIALSNLNNNINIPEMDKKQLPTKIEAHIMTKILNSESFNGNEIAKNLLRQWYDQVGTNYYLKPIYINNSAISSDSLSDRQQAWQQWLKDSIVLMKAISEAISTDEELISKVSMKGHFDNLIEFILKEPGLQKRTLLIKGQLTGNTSVSAISPAQLNLNELARILPDPNKMSLKRSMNTDEFVKTTSNWVQENFSKFFDSILENQVSHGKYIPPFIDKNLFQELTSQRTHLQNYLDNVSGVFSAKSQNFYISQVLPILNTVAVEANNNPTTVSSQSKSGGSAVKGSSNHLVFISGPKGCGKSSLISQLIKLSAKDFHDRAHIIYRYCGISLDSLSCNRLLRSICEQFCQIQGENITAASYVYSNREAIIGALNKIVASQPTILFLDGLDLFSSKSLSDLDWLCEFDASSNIKIIISIETDSNLYKKALNSYTDASYITLNNPTVSEWTQVLSSSVRSRQFSSANVMEEIRRMNTSKEGTECQLNYHDMNDILNLTRIRKLNNEATFVELSFKDDQPITRAVSMNKVLSNLEYIITPYQLGSLIILLHSSRNGLFERDLINMITTISQSSKVYADAEYSFPLSLWNYVRIQLKPWLSTIICDKFIKIRIQDDFAQHAIDYFASKRFPAIIDEARDVLYEFFNRSNATRTSKFGLLKLDNDKPELKGNSKHLGGSILATQASEIANYLVLTNKSKAMDYLLNRTQFFSQFLYGSMPEEFIEDCDRLKNVEGKNASHYDDLLILVNFVKQSIYPLRYDGYQIYSQIYCRAYDFIKYGKSNRSKKINDILNSTNSPPVTSLLPISEASINSFIKTRIGLQPLDNSSGTHSSDITQQQLQGKQPPKAQSKQKIFTIKEDHRHVVVIYPEKGMLSVWNIYEEVPVRTINNLDYPRDLRMIDKQRAVILCNRELRVYDLDSGNMLTKLKGVMNQKMPFFEVFGDNYVIALARNRMYVNLLNLKTGELETTFKVGEDRFLNSLLVSADGGICVCGDETQKPFPLLVWNLNERRLMYDLRLDRHEFLTKFSAISDDGQIVVSACRQIGVIDNVGSSPGDNGPVKTVPNFIVIYDLSSGTLFKKWKPGLDTCAVAIAYLPNKSGKLVINAIADSSILVWDLVTGSKKHTLTGHSAPPDVVRVQNGRLFSMDSTLRDQSLRIWDLEEGYCLGIFSPDAPISCCQMSIRGDALVCGFASELRLSTLVMCKNETIAEVLKRNKRRKSSKSIYIFDEPPSRKSSSG